MQSTDAVQKWMRYAHSPTCSASERISKEHSFLRIVRKEDKKNPRDIQRYHVVANHLQQFHFHWPFWRWSSVYWTDLRSNASIKSILFLTHAVWLGQWWLYLYWTTHIFLCHSSQNNSLITICIAFTLCQVLYRVRVSSRYIICQRLDSVRKWN